MFSFNETATRLARNPLGIIALFIVLVYGFASLVTAFAGSFSADERLPLIYFLVFYPVAVLAVFAWLVSCHSGKLFAPSDFEDEENYVKMQMAVVASLGAASAKGNQPATEQDIRRIIEVARSTEPASGRALGDWRRQILWVDDRPENNTYERQAFEALGLRISLALSTDDALERLAQNNLQPSSATWDARKAPGKDMFFSIRFGMMAIKRLCSSMLLPMPQNTNARLVNMVAKGVPIVPKSFSPW